MTQRLPYLPYKSQPTLLNCTRENCILGNIDLGALRHKPQDLGNREIKQLVNDFKHNRYSDVALANGWIPSKRVESYRLTKFLEDTYLRLLKFRLRANYKNSISNNQIVTFAIESASAYIKNNLFKAIFPTDIKIAELDNDAELDAELPNYIEGNAISLLEHVGVIKAQGTPCLLLQLSAIMKYNHWIINDHK